MTALLRHLTTKYLCTRKYEGLTVAVRNSAKTSYFWSPQTRHNYILLWPAISLVSQ